jgi:hypothetical protein
MTPVIRIHVPGKEYIYINRNTIPIQAYFSVSDETVSLADRGTPVIYSLIINDI